MATGYFAHIVDGVVAAVHRVSHDHIAANPSQYGGQWVEVPDMAQYPAKGWSWSVGGGFVPPMPYASWSWDSLARVWVPPVSYPEDGGEYGWDEASQSWVALTQ